MTNNLFAKGVPAAAGGMHTAGEGPFCFILRVLHLDAVKPGTHLSWTGTCVPFSFKVIHAFGPVLLLSIFQN